MAGRLLTSLPRCLDAVKVGQTSHPIALGLLVMMWAAVALSSLGSQALTG